MRVAHFKITRPEEYWWTPTYYKIIETKEGSSEVSLFKGNLNFTEDTGDSFDERIRLVYDRTMRNERIVKVEREEYDMFYKRLVQKLNQLGVA